MEVERNSKERDRGGGGEGERRREKESTECVFTLFESWRYQGRKCN